jgi:NAD-reducing hydrogenase large subunit
MSKRIVIDPVTRIEGHAKISIFVDDAGAVTDAQFHVVEFRGFEKFCEGRMFWEMPAITARTCGICPVSHLLASSKASDEILSVKVPPVADKMRRLMNMGQIVQSHALSFFHLSAPDFLIGWDAPVAERNIVGIIRENPELARAGIRLRQFGQEIIELLGGKKVHPSWAVPGGVRSGLTAEGREHILAKLPEAFATTHAALDLFKGVIEKSPEEVETIGKFDSLFMGLVAEDGEWEHHGGLLRFSNSKGQIIADKISARDYQDHIGEAVQSSSYLKSPYYKPLGFPAGMYRVGPLARLNVCDFMGTQKADAELREYRHHWGGRAVTSCYLYHYARLIEILACLERIEILMDDPDLFSTHLRADAGVNSLRGVGVSEAPRGTLFHDYTVDENGVIQSVNMIIATGQNNLAMNRSVFEIARKYVTGPEIPEGVLNRVEHGIRNFDPCLSCSTHALGKMPMQLRLIGPGGTVLDEVTRDG